MQKPAERGGEGEGGVEERGERREGEGKILTFWYN